VGVLDAYKLTILIIGLTGLTFLIQLIVVDLIGIKAKHRPGFPIKANYNDIHFRADRAFSNSNESVSIYILLVLFSILSFADPDRLNMSCACYLIGRIGHMVCYYLNLGLFRSISFGVSLVGLIGVFIAGIITWV
jgi:uncharacterized MAPEG superfamily protein